MPRLSTILGGLWADVRHGVRLLARHPAFSAIAVASIAFGTGANVAVFSAVDALLLRPPPVPRPGELVTVGTRVSRGLVTLTVASCADYEDIRDRTQTLAGLAAFTSFPAGISPTADAQPRVRLATFVSANYFHVLGVDVDRGRAFLPEEARTPGRAVAVLGYGLWQSMFAGAPDVVGHTVWIGGHEFSIVGIAPQTFTGLNARYVGKRSFCRCRCGRKFGAGR